MHCNCDAYLQGKLGCTECKAIVLRGVRHALKILSVPPTVNQTIRFPSDLAADVEKLIQNKGCTFSAFVIAAVRAAVEEVRAKE
jgi:hypothetical protein